MPDKKQLPFLVRLLDDDSPLVQETVIKELKKFGPSLEEELKKLAMPLNEFQEMIIRDILDVQSRESLKEVWNYWFHLESDYAKLEMAMSFISRFLQGNPREDRLKESLDNLAREYQCLHHEVNIYTLAQFLFHEKKYKGVPSERYYLVCNSDLLDILERKEGLPISLVLLFMLVADRVGIVVEGCNYPGHFLARATYEGKVKLIDCYNGGTFIDETKLHEQNRIDGVFDVIHAKVDAETIIMRVLHNLIRAAQEHSNHEYEDFFQDLLTRLETHLQSS